MTNSLPRSCFNIPSRRGKGGSDAPSCFMPKRPELKAVLMSLMVRFNKAGVGLGLGRVGSALYKH